MRGNCVKNWVRMYATRREGVREREREKLKGIYGRWCLLVAHNSWCDPSEFVDLGIKVIVKLPSDFYRIKSGGGSVWVELLFKWISLLKKGKMCVNPSKSQSGWEKAGIMAQNWRERFESISISACCLFFFSILKNMIRNAQNFKGRL